MTKVRIEPGICNFTTLVIAVLDDSDEDEPYAVKLKITSGCPSVRKMAEELGEDFDGMAICVQKPGKGELYEFAQKNFPVHAACPVINGIIKCVEAECGLALKKDASIKFIEE